jgi:hypothetical protein
MAKKKKSKRAKRNIYDRYGEFIGLKTNELPAEHRAKSGGLRCFRKVLPRDENGNKLPDGEKSRCGSSCAKGSLYCRHHGGGNTHALVHGDRQNTTLMQYKGSFNNELKDVLESFMNDPKLMDLKPELSMLRAVFTNYIQKINDNETKKNPRTLIRMIENVVEDDDLDHHEKWISIREIVNSQQALHDGEVVDRVIRCAEAIGKNIERIDKIQSRKELMYTQDGLKILLRGITNLINEVFNNNPEKVNEFREKLLELSITTGNNIIELNKRNDDSNQYTA